MTIYSILSPKSQSEKDVDFLKPPKMFKSVDVFSDYNFVAVVKRRTSHEPNRMLMKLNEGEQRVFLICI